MSPTSMTALQFTYDELHCLGLNPDMAACVTAGRSPTVEAVNEGKVLIERLSVEVQHSGQAYPKCEIWHQFTDSEKAVWRARFITIDYNLADTFRYLATYYACTKDVNTIRALVFLKECMEWQLALLHFPNPCLALTIDNLHSMYTQTIDCRIRVLVIMNHFAPSGFFPTGPSATQSAETRQPSRMMTRQQMHQQQQQQPVISINPALLMGQPMPQRQ